jgi:hypothetical protein
MHVGEPAVHALVLVLLVQPVPSSQPRVTVSRVAAVHDVVVPALHPVDEGMHAAPPAISTQVSVTWSPDPSHDGEAQSVVVVSDVQERVAASQVPRTETTASPLQESESSAAQSSETSSSSTHSPSVQVKVCISSAAPLHPIVGGQSSSVMHVGGVEVSGIVPSGGPASGVSLSGGGEVSRIPPSPLASSIMLASVTLSSEQPTTASALPTKINAPLRVIIVIRPPPGWRLPRKPGLTHSHTASCCYSPASMTDLSTFFREKYVELFNRGVALLEARASEGDEAQRVLDDVKGAKGASLLRFVEEDDGDALEVWLALEGGVMSVVEAQPEGVPMRLSVAMPKEAAELWVSELEKREELDSDEAAVRVARGASREIEEAVGEESLDFELILVDTPDFDEVRVKIALHAEEPPEKPTFTAQVRWDDLEDMREAGQNLQHLMMGGKLKLGGDYTRAMQVAMELMQKRR